MPPGHSKTETWSKLFSSYFLWRFPEQWVSLASYGQKLANRNSKQSRLYYKTAGGDLDPAMSQVREWHTLSGGGLWAVGRGGAATGSHYHLGIADDMIKGEREARSKDVLENLMDWWGSVFYTRALEDSSIVIVQTQWNESDLAGSTLAAEEDEIKLGRLGLCENWHVVYMPAIMPSEKHRRVFPSSCTVEPDNRKPGEILWPERFPLRELLLRRKNAKEWWEPLYQQNPIPMGGGIITKAMLSDVRALGTEPMMLRRVAFADLAVSEKESADLTVCFVVGLGIDGRYYVFPPYIAQEESPVTVVEIARLAKQYRASILGYEDVAYQRSFGQQMKRLIRSKKDRNGRLEFAGLAVKGIRPDRDREARARAWTPLAEECGLVLLDDGSGWIDEVVPIMTRFPKSRYKDHVDALGGALMMLSEIATGASKARSGGKR